MAKAKAAMIRSLMNKVYTIVLFSAHGKTVTDCKDLFNDYLNLSEDQVAASNIMVPNLDFC